MRKMMTCRKMVFVGCVLLLVATGMAQKTDAEPTPQIQFLMRESVTLMDWGINNIENHLYQNRSVFVRNENNLFEKEPALAVNYDWEKNAIQIAIGLRIGEQIQKTSVRLQQIKSHVEFVVTFLRGSLSMKPFDSFFRHRGFRNKESPENMESALSNITEMTVTVRDSDANILSRCHAPLVGSQVEWLTIGGP